MELRLYDTLTREKRPFQPLDPARVRMYVCGPTVYDFAHIGNARPAIVFDVLFRMLRHVYGDSHVAYVRNITDVDDKINARAAQEYPGLPLNEAIRLVTEKTERQYHEDVAALGCLAPTVEPRATEHIEEMKALIEQLIESGSAYVEQEHVLFSVPSMQDYGKLSKRTLDEMVAGARVEVAPYKRDPRDFVLWKPSKPGEPAWPSPAGIAALGRPGWHIECSAMSDRWLWEEAKPYLSDVGRAHPHQFDIHGGGIDLVFPHHENEVAQSRCAFHTPRMANFWMHNGFLQVQGAKMSKSEGNFVTIRGLLTHWAGRSWPGNAVRLAMIDSHYLQPINWTHEKLAQAEADLLRFASGMLALSANVFSNNLELFANFVLGTPRTVPQGFLDLLLDDLNTPAALSFIRHRLSKMDTNPHVAIEVLNALEFLGLIDRGSIFLNQSPGLLKIFNREEFEWASYFGRELTVALRNKDAARFEEGKAAFESRSIQVRHLPLGMVYLEKTAPHSAEEAKIKELIAARTLAREAKNFREADRIRDELAGMGVVLKDSKDGTTWEITR
jgi:cysteinyl-tRNA synthetase